MIDGITTYGNNSLIDTFYGVLGADGSDLYASGQKTEHGCDDGVRPYHGHVPTCEIHGEALAVVFAFLADDSAKAGEGVHHAGQPDRFGRPGVLVQIVAVEQFLSGFDGSGQVPEDHDIVERLVHGGNFHELHRAFSPVSQGLHPHARPLVVEQDRRAHV